LTVDSEVITRAGQRLLVIYVPLSPEIHADTQGRALRRAGKNCIPMAPNEVARLREERHGVDPSAQPPIELYTTSHRRPSRLLATGRRRSRTSGAVWRGWATKTCYERSAYLMEKGSC